MLHEFIGVLLYPGNDLGPDSVKAIGDALTVNTTLRTLDLSRVFFFIHTAQYWTLKMLYFFVFIRKQDEE